MPTILLNSTLEDEYQKQLCSIKLEQFYHQRKVKNRTRALSVTCLVCLVVAAFNGLNWIFLAFAIIVFWWIIFGLDNMAHQWGIDRRERRLRKDVEGYFDPSLRISFTFNTEELSLTIHKHREEKNTVSWAFFLGYSDSGKVLLLATVNSECLCFTRQEMGEAAFEELRQLAQVKLPTLKNYFKSKKEWWQFLVEKA